MRQRLGGRPLPRCFGNSSSPPLHSWWAEQANIASYIYHCIDRQRIGVKLESHLSRSIGHGCLGSSPQPTPMSSRHDTVQRSVALWQARRPRLLECSPWLKRVESVESLLQLHLKLRVYQIRRAAGGLCAMCLAVDAAPCRLCNDASFADLSGGS